MSKFFNIVFVVKFVVCSFFFVKHYIGRFLFVKLVACGLNFREMCCLLIFLIYLYIFLVKLILCCFILLWNLIYHDVYLLELVACWCLFVKHDTYCFCSWNLFYVDSFFERLNVSYFVLSRNLLCFFRQTFYMLIFLFVKLVHLFFFMWNWFCSWKFCVLIFVHET